MGTGKLYCSNGSCEGSSLNDLVCHRWNKNNNDDLSLNMWCTSWYSGSKDWKINAICFYHHLEQSSLIPVTTSRLTTSGMTTRTSTSSMFWDKRMKRNFRSSSAIRRVDSSSHQSFFLNVSVIHSFQWSYQIFLFSYGIKSPLNLLLSSFSQSTTGTSNITSSLYWTAGFIF